jgi:hypothetical protein
MSGTNELPGFQVLKNDGVCQGGRDVPDPGAVS